MRTRQNFFFRFIGLGLLCFYMMNCFICCMRRIRWDEDTIFMVMYSFIVLWIEVWMDSGNLDLPRKDFMGILILCWNFLSESLLGCMKRSKVEATLSLLNQCHLRLYFNGLISDQYFDTSFNPILSSPNFHFPIFKFY